MARAQALRPYNGYAIGQIFSSHPLIYLSPPVVISILEISLTQKSEKTLAKTLVKLSFFLLGVSFIRSKGI
ncbi:MAG: hypothetical protein QNJ51_20830 [Calothrix sp. MO_167.B12]|nr:hypothetical protein [Calothrix sp. MO_167.B12]